LSSASASWPRRCSDDDHRHPQPLPSIIPVARQAGLTDDEIVASLADDRVRRNAEKRLGMKKRSDATWAYVGQFTADTLRRLNARKGA
jgi:hypothetical protein